MKKMMVVNPDTLNRQARLFEAPEKTKAVALDEKMQEILNRQDITDEEKVKLYENALNLYSVFRDKVMAPPPPAPKTTPPTPPPPLHFVDDVIASVPKALRGKAEQLTRTVLRELAWSPKGELMIDGRAVPGTHIVDLINDAIRLRKKFNPKGRDEFVKRLSGINVPQELIGNPSIWERLRHRRGESDRDETEDPKATHPRREETPMYTPGVSLSEQIRRRDRYLKAARWLEYPEN